MNQFKIPIYAIIINHKEDKREQIRQLIGFIEYSPLRNEDNKKFYSLNVQNILMTQSINYFESLNREYINEELDKEVK